MSDEEQLRRFAVEVVQRLRGAGFEAYWAGGCVRDEILGRRPKDYDVATSARPAEIRELFGKRRTLALGAAFGVITVLGPPARHQQSGGVRCPAPMIEVATFRQDVGYSDGRHPDSVTFSSAREDALRRDFTINGMFFDPLSAQVIDFVGGQDDLQLRRIRAIGDARLRFEEDKLRMLRAVRFAAGFDFAIDPPTLAAVREMAAEINVVSAERIAAEMRRVLTEGGRVRGVQLLQEIGLADAVLPEIAPRDEASRAAAERGIEVLARLRAPHFPLALAALLVEQKPAAVCGVGLRWKLSNKETDEAAWLVDHRAALVGASAARWSAVQPLLAHAWAAALVDLHEAAHEEFADDAAWCRQRLAWPREALDPPPLVTGDDLRASGLPPGPAFKHILQAVRDAQLDGELRTKDDALKRAVDLWDRSRANKSPII